VTRNRFSSFCPRAVASRPPPGKQEPLKTSPHACTGEPSKADLPAITPHHHPEQQSSGPPVQRRPRRTRRGPFFAPTSLSTSSCNKTPRRPILCRCLHRGSLYRRSRFLSFCSLLSNRLFGLLEGKRGFQRFKLSLPCQEVFNFFPGAVGPYVLPRTALPRPEPPRKWLATPHQAWPIACDMIAVKKDCNVNPLGLGTPSAAARILKGKSGGHPNSPSGSQIRRQAAKLKKPPPRVWSFPIASLEVRRRPSPVQGLRLVRPRNLPRRPAMNRSPPRSTVTLDSTHSPSGREPSILPLPQLAPAGFQQGQADVSFPNPLGPIKEGRVYPPVSASQSIIITRGREQETSTAGSA